MPAISNAQDYRQSTGPTPREKCRYILELSGTNPLEAYQACIRAETEGIGIACTFFSWGAATVIRQTLRTLFGVTVCPDNGLKQAEEAVANWLARQAQQANQANYNCSGGTVIMQTCHCPSGTEHNGTGCVQRCPAGQFRHSGSGACVPNTCPAGTIRGSGGYCQTYTPPTPSPTPHYDPPLVPPGSCTSGGPNDPAICHE